MSDGTIAARPLRVEVVGAGGLGSYVAGILANAGHDVRLVIRGAHAEAVETRGLEIRTPRDGFLAHPRPVSPESAPAPADVAFVAVKAYSLDEVAPRLAALAAEGAVVVPLLNGVDISDRLRAAGVPEDRLVDGVAYLTAFRTAPGVVERKGEHQRLVIGSTGGHNAQGLQTIHDLFAPTDVEVVTADDIRVEIWLKMAVVSALATICGITGAALGPIRAHPFGRDLQTGAISEVLAVGRGHGVALPPDAESRVERTLDGFPESFYPSVLHDLRSGRRTEMDALGGTLARLGRAVGVPTPLLDAATCAVALNEVTPED
ncbi:MAG: ketopantoate reductase family protein [Gemmatimonadota bacterium]|nr:ketopantoate reductase family protein [Gemmatimonadota bacterium]